MSFFKNKKIVSVLQFTVYFFCFQILNRNLSWTFVFILIKLKKNRRRKNVINTGLVKGNVPCDIYSQFHLNFKKRRIQFLYIFESYYCVVILAITVEIAFVCIYKFIYIVHSIVIICNLTCNLTSDKTKPKLFFYQLFTTIVSVPVLCEEYTN